MDLKGDKEILMSLHHLQLHGATENYEITEWFELSLRAQPIPSLGKWHFRTVYFLSN